ncbi:HNH endonuclease signature motif containing protein [Kineosporia sp. NBRC 101677]|uniref:HNH endonuclease signature motif containing protein n=1 Tax=Kineosporia sp. NBRC 101677 TaxID=3032197 RepID=UPI002552150D|nr:HNH endonuclease signature motif containing protein [Kineosporia sp. NBRC 101677]
MGVFEWLLEELGALGIPSADADAGSDEGGAFTGPAEGTGTAKASDRAKASGTAKTASTTKAGGPAEPARRTKRTEPSPPESPDAWVTNVMAMELVMRRLQAAQMLSLATAVEAVPSARRGGARVDEDHEEHDGHDEPEDLDSAFSITSRRLVSSRLAPELNRHPRSAAGDVEVAMGLVRNLPRIFALLEQGRIDADRARLAARQLHAACERYPQLRPGNDVWQLTEAMVTAQAPDLTFGELKRLIQRLLMELDPDGGAAHHAQAMRGRHARISAQPDGMALVTALVSAETGQLLDGFLDAAADAARDRAEAEGLPDGRTHDQRRADVLALLVQALAEGVHIPLVPDPRNEARDEPSAYAAAGEASTTSGTSESGATSETEGKLRKPRHEPEHAEPHTTSDTVPESLRRRLEDDLQAVTDERHHALTAHGFPPVPQGLMPAWWKIPDLPRRKGRGTHLVVTITDTTLLGLDQIPGLLQGHGVISAEHARRLAVAPGQITLLVLPGACTHDHAGNDTSPDDGTGPDSDAEPQPAASEPCPLGRDHTRPQTRRYRPDRTLTNQVFARYPVCTFPGCTTPASRCDLDHLKPFQRGGPTCACNMHPACRGHHRLKTFAGWHARPARPGEPHPPGTIIWTTPDGTDHASAPPCLPGMPGWSLRGRTTASSDQPESLTRIDLMPSAERTARRTRRWSRDLQWQADRQDRLRRRAAARLAAQQTAKAEALRSSVARPPHAPWGEATGIYPEYGEPTF